MGFAFGSTHPTGLRGYGATELRRRKGLAERDDQLSMRLSAGRPSAGHLRAIHLAKSFAATTASDRATTQRANVSKAGTVSCGHGVCHNTSPRCTIHCHAILAIIADSTM